MRALLDHLDRGYAALMSRPRDDDQPDQPVQPGQDTAASPGSPGASPEAAREADATIRSISRLEESN